MLIGSSFNRGIFITMKTMDIIFDDLDRYGELLADISVWRQENGLPRAKVIVGVVEDNVDGIDYYVITVNETIFSYLMLREFGMTKKYGREGWNGYIESRYNCETA
jgi:hypothetical protein